MKKKVATVAVTALLCCIVFWVGSIVRYDVMTAQHIDEFREFEEVENAFKCKILTYTDNYARIYCVDSDKYAGNIYAFIRAGDTWEFYMWETTVWSSEGSADGFIWPYIR